MSETTTRWWWLRHAPALDPDDLVVGRSDPPARTDDAPAFAALARALPAAPRVLVTSLRRSRETAAALRAGGFDAPEPEVEDGLLEQDFGAWEGRPRAEVFGAMPATHPFWAAPAATPPPGGESFVELRDRVAAAVARCTARFAGADIVVVGHAGPVRAALALALDLAPEAALRFAVDPLSLTRIDHLAGPAPGWRVVGVNRAVAR